jgi:hypothetical protein
LSFSTIFQLDIETVPTVRYFLFLILTTMRYYKSNTINMNME